MGAPAPTLTFASMSFKARVSFLLCAIADTTCEGWCLVAAASLVLGCGLRRAVCCSPSSDQGLTLVHFSAQRMHILWNTLGA